MKEIKINDISVTMEIIRSRRKTLSIQIAGADRIIARAPMKMSEESIRSFILSKADRIEKLIIKARETECRLNELRPFTNEEINRMTDEALKIIPERVKYYARLVGVTYRKITIRNQKTWRGSCSGKGNLNFNCLLAITPAEVLDSIVVHELCHRKHMNHSKEFYAEVYRVFPEYDKCSKWLKENGSLLIARLSSQRWRTK